MYVSLDFVFARQEITDVQDIITIVDSSKNPSESLVQRYYAFEDLRQEIRFQYSSPPLLSKTLSNLDLITDKLREELDLRKSLASQNKTIPSRVDQYRSGVVTNNKPLDKPCPQYETLVDDWSFAFDLPPSLVMATWLMESGCSRYRPNNGDGIFQITSKDYGTGKMNTGYRIWMVYDFNDFLRAKFLRYQKTNNLPQVLDMNYSYISYTGAVEFGALYNGLSGGKIR